MKQLQEDRYVNASELAQILNVSRATVYQMSKKGFLPKGKKNRQFKALEPKRNSRIHERRDLMFKTKLEKVVPYATYELINKLAEAQSEIKTFLRGQDDEFVDVEGIMRVVQENTREILYHCIGLMRIFEMWKDATDDD